MTESAFACTATAHQESDGTILTSTTLETSIPTGQMAFLSVSADITAGQDLLDASPVPGITLTDSFTDGPTGAGDSTSTASGQTITESAAGGGSGSQGASSTNSDSPASTSSENGAAKGHVLTGSILAAIFGLVVAL